MILFSGNCLRLIAYIPFFQKKNIGTVVDVLMNKICVNANNVDPNYGANANSEPWILVGSAYVPYDKASLRRSGAQICFVADPRLKSKQ